MFGYGRGLAILLFVTLFGQGVASDVAALEGDVNSSWLILCGALVFYMQLGFGMLEAGSIRYKNAANILFKNVMDAAVGAILFYLIGYAFAYGDDKDGSFIGRTNFAVENEDFASWFFQWAFAATAATIVSGSVAERCSVEGYFIYSIFITSLIYPVVVHWVWDAQGWLSAFNLDANGKNLNATPAVDFAGSGVVHMVGGFCGLMGAVVLGPRRGRFSEAGELVPMRGHSLPLQVLGTFILWFGWYGFNCGSTLAVSGAMKTGGRVACTTTLAAAAASLSAVLASYISSFPNRTYDLSRACNGALAGLVSITAGCSVVSGLSSIAIGLIGGLLYVGSSTLLLRLKIDDPLDACPIHGVCGFWGVIAVGIFATEEILEEAAYSATIRELTVGRRFLNQLVEAVAVMLWSCGTSVVLFVAIDKTMGLRISEEEEIKGLDKAEHGGSAYSFGLQSRLSSINMAKLRNDEEVVSPISNVSCKLE